MITLYTFGPYFGMPDGSPFCIKAEVLLKMSGLPYRLDHGGFMKAPKGKQPYIVDGSTTVADSTFIRWHLEQAHGIDFDTGLSAEQKAAGWAIEKLCEDNIYWGIVRDRWMNDTNFDKGPRQYFDKAPALLRPLIIAKTRRNVKANLHGQGLGRHSVADGERIVAHGIGALSALIGDKPFLMGDTPCGADATVFAWAVGLLCPHFDGPTHRAALSHANLVAYRDRGMARWYPEMAASKAA
jgi:glutathione S-transferase